MTTRAVNRKRARHLALVPPPPKNTASINIRLSKKATEENLSKDGMLADAKALASRLGLTVPPGCIHIDEKSGAIRDREGFMDWLGDAREGRVDTLIAYHVDRMTREGINVAAIILDVVEGKDSETGAVVRHPVRLVDCKGLDSQGDPQGFRWSFVIKAEIAREERERMSERSLDMHRRFKAEGKRTGGDDPYGFQIKDKKSRKLIPLPEEARYLRETAEMLWAADPDVPVKDRVTVGSVVRWMNQQEGCKPRRAKSWSRTTLIQCLSRTPDATETDIFTPDERASLRTLLETKPGTGPLHKGGRPTGERGGRAGTHVGSGGLLVCKGCGSNMNIHPRVRGGRKRDGSDRPKVKVDDYRCSANPGACPLGSPAVFSGFMDPYLEERFLDTYGDRPQYERRATVAGYAAVEEAELRVAEALAELGREATAEAFAELQAAQVARQEAAEVPQEVTVRLDPSGRTLREVWAAAGMTEKQQMLRNAFGKIVVGPGRRGQRKMDEDRLEFLGVLAGEHILGVDDPADYRPGMLVLVPELDDDAVASARTADEVAAREAS
jgi:DNA invertase Pin-like site-specific DNA recombinase